MRIAGIDPGVSGGVAVFEDGCLVELYRFKKKETGRYRTKTHNSIDANDLSEFLNKTKVDVAYIELVASMPSNSAQSNFTFGYTTGKMEAVVEVAGAEIKYVRPQEWKEYWGLTGTDKMEAVTLCCESWKDFFEPRAVYSGRADAALIGRYGYLQY